MTAVRCDVLRRQLDHFLERVKHRRDAPAPTACTCASLATARPVDRPLAAAIDLATDLMQQHGLTGWRIKLDHARRRAGQCDYNTRVISLSRHYVRHADPEHIRDTILHEIAHALVGPNHGHDAVWRQKARQIGCTATRCHTLNFAKSRWIMTCPNGCFAVERHRRRDGLVCLSCKTPVQFVNNESATGAHICS